MKSSNHLKAAIRHHSFLLLRKIKQYAFWITKHLQHLPTPHADDIFSKLGNSKVFSVIDLKNA